MLLPVLPSAVAAVTVFTSGALVERRADLTALASARPTRIRID